MHLLQPSVLVLEDVRHAGSRRSKRVSQLIGKLTALARELGVTVMLCSRDDVLTAFARTGACTKDDIAAAITKLVPELAQRLPHDGASGIASITPWRFSKQRRWR